MQSNKSYEGWILGLYNAMLSDIVEYIPCLRSDCERDYKRLLSAIEHHGIPFILDTMVQYGKHFDRCLSDGRLTKTGLCHFRTFRRGVPIPRLFKGLILRVFDSNGELRSCPDKQAIRFLRQLFNCFKSFKIDCPKSRIYENVQDFFSTDDEVRLPSLSWDGDCPGFDSASHLQFGDAILSQPHLDDSTACGLDPDSVPAFSREDYEVVHRTADIVTSILGRFDPSEWRTQHGPGAVSDLRGSSIDKYSFPQWPDRLDEVFPFEEFAFANYHLWADAVNHESWVAVCDTLSEPRSRLLVVPKTYRAPRLIASEPTALQWCQQAIKNYFVDRVSQTPIASSICFKDQGANQRYALEASHSGSHATIDLSAASDRISCWLVERFFRRSPSLLQALYATRTREIEQDLCKKLPRVKSLRKFSTMGSAVTFPIQTILFSIIACSATLIVRGMKPTMSNIRRISREVQVFGDEIIVPIDSWDRTEALLTTFGLKVNRNKTFGVGNFRESCGVDAYDGENVSKVSILSMPLLAAPEKVLSSVDVHNNLLMGGWSYAAQYVRRAVDRIRRYTFPEVAPFCGSVGWFTFGDCNNDHLLSRWSEQLHRREYRYTLPTGKAERIPTGQNSSYLQYFLDAAGALFVEGDRIGVAKMRTPLKLRATWAPINP